VRCLLIAILGVLGAVAAQADDARTTYRQRVDAVTGIPGFVALWDFVEREDGVAGSGRFVAHTPRGDSRQYPIEARNIIRSFWRKGREASYADFPLSGSGPFGQAVRFEKETEPDFLPTLLVSRSNLHDSRLDVKGPGGSVSMVIWTSFEDGGHVLAGIWHEGTDISAATDQAAVVEQGRRQYASFAGLGGNPGASAVHVSENGRSSFTDKYARNLAVTPGRIPRARWAAVGFVFDNDRDTATAYLDGTAAEYWIEKPGQHPFFKWPSKGWRQAQLSKIPGLQPGEDEGYPRDQFYEPPEGEPRKELLVYETAEERVVIKSYSFTKVRETYRVDRDGSYELLNRELLALRVNPFFFGHDLYAPKTPEEGGPFTIGRVIKSSRGQGNTAFYGGVAVFDRALKATEMKTLAEINRPGEIEIEKLIR
jgi:hypothetical protein